MESRGLIAQAVGDMGRATSELVFALADFEPQYLRVFESHIDNALLRIRDAENALTEARVRVKQALDFQKLQQE